MKTLSLFLLILSSNILFGQDGDASFPKYVLDSLHQLYQSKVQTYNNCKTEDLYFSLRNTTGSLYYNASAQKSAFAQDYAQMSKDSLLQMYPKTKVISEVFVVEMNQQTHKDYYTYAVFINGEWQNYKAVKSIDKPTFAAASGHIKGKQGVHYYESILYFDQPWNYQKLDAEFADLISYAQCLVNAEIPIFLNHPSDQHKDEKSARQLIQYIDSLASLHYIDSTNWHKHKRRNAWINNYATKDKYVINAYKTLIGKPHNEFIHPTLEKLAYQLEDFKGILSFHRNHPITGSCSMDERPILQLEKIAKSAALNMDWDLFIKAHLDLINNRFSAFAYSSYGVANREAPAKSLESIFDPTALFLGTILQYHQSYPKQYISNRFQIAKSLLLLSHREQAIEWLIDMSTSSGLDLYNRLCIFDMLNYMHKIDPSSIHSSILKSIRAQLPANQETILE